MGHHPKPTPKTYVCDNCENAIIAPTHCGRVMEFLEERNLWQCWKGEHEPCCGRDSVLDFEVCCDSPQLSVAIAIEDKNILL